VKLNFPRSVVIRNITIQDLGLLVWFPCHHGMARPQVADGGDSLQFWRVAANILNKQSWTVEKGWSSGLGLGVGLTTPHRKK
jgi:hypothetical protein